MKCDLSAYGETSVESRDVGSIIEVGGAPGLRGTLLGLLELRSSTFRGEVNHLILHDTKGLILY